jgi:phosphoribosylamine--glycine ligase
VGLPILFDGDISASDKSNLHFGEVGMDGDQLVTAGYHGWSMVVTGVGATLGEASDNAYRLARRVVIPNVRYRNDIGAKLVAGDLAALERLEMFSD